ncbi:GNAT superfamily N-acetyltransferase [Microbacterium endophyticum]|uniref:GNAT superfamily N-acetyltransferase n=1 Tax=Microbacterium endophyticum TaxID=1526412 RepID=A0A7W4V1F0_9MICO|nr:GNAT family N-acetyltransferase [Microbacterium endophyticum]MBB2974525.1 GNAT superfamily N-acetyltransferase [Microbacterium endophyticum]NIK36822.1 GNAT superfamily N-acetyltransferase [Microbacterium endophyticum]
MLETLILPVSLPTAASSVTLRRAELDDVEYVMTLLTDDPISAARGDAADIPDVAIYADALHRITNNPSNELLVCADSDGRVVGTMQLTLIPGMARRGSTRLLVEAVRVARKTRSGGIGSAMIQWVTSTAAPSLGSSLVQLTSDVARTDAHRFYTRLGFEDSHVGFKYVV